MRTFKNVKNEIKKNPYFLLSYTGENQKGYSQEYALDEIEDIPIAIQDYKYGFIYTYSDKESLIQEILRELKNLDLTEGADDTYYDYNPDTYQSIITGSILAGIWESVKPEIESRLQKYWEWVHETDAEEISEYSDINDAIDNAHHYLQSIL